MNTRRLSILAGAVLLAAGASAGITLPFTDTFDSAASSSSYVVRSQDFGATGTDVSAEFGFNYGAYQSISNAPSPEITIPEAPSALGGTPGRGLGLQVNATNDDPTDDRAAINVYPDINFGTGFDWVMTVDAFTMWNGPPDVSGTGTTQYVMLGWTADGANTNWHNVANVQPSSGAWVAITGEAGNSNTSTTQSDMSLYVGNGAVPTRTELADGNTPPLTTVFPVPPLPGGLFGEGAPGRTWVTYELRYINDIVTLSATPALTGSSGILYTGPNPSSTNSGFAFIGQMDTFSSLAVPAVDNLTVFDNLHIEEFVVLGAENFSLYR